MGFCWFPRGSARWFVVRLTSGEGNEGVSLEKGMNCPVESASTPMRADASRFSTSSGHYGPGR